MRSLPLVPRHIYRELAGTGRHDPERGGIGAGNPVSQVHPGADERLHESPLIPFSPAARHERAVRRLLLQTRVVLGALEPELPNLLLGEYLLAGHEAPGEGEVEVRRAKIR